MNPASGKKCRSIYWLLTIAIALPLLFSVPSVQAFQFETDNPDLKVYWDNTLKYSAAWRLNEKSDELTDPAKNPSNTNQDDGDRNFDEGLISSRFDLLSEFDVIYKNYGFRLSGAAWFDSIYTQDNDNDSPATANARSVDNDEFTDETEELHGKDAEILDAFVFGTVDMGNNALDFRIGQFAQQWGQSLFFGNNGIAGGMVPIDAVKLLSVPNTQFKELLRPVPQIGGQLLIGSKLTLGAYYQFGWEKTRLPGVGSYFSADDPFDEGGERVILGPPLPGTPPGSGPAAFFRASDLEADDDGQFGVQLVWLTDMDLDIGFHYVRYHAKEPWLYARLFAAPPTGPGPPPPPFNPAEIDPIAGKIGEYYLVYPEDIDMFGISASSTFGEWNLAAEISYRQNTPLVATLQAYPAPPGIDEPDNNDDPLYPVGNSLHFNFNWLASFGPNFIAQESSFLGEIAWHKQTEITENEDAVDPNATDDAIGIRMVYEPTYRQILPGLDLSVPIGLSYFPKGTSSVIAQFGPDKGGDVTIGITGTYNISWKFNVSYTHYYGDEGGTLDANQDFSNDQNKGDRDFISFYITHTF